MNELALYVRQLSRAALSDKDGYVAVIRIFMDESGTHQGSPAISIGAHMAKPKTWTAFTKKWNAVKRYGGKSPIGVYHSSECEALRGEFQHWSEVERNQFVAKLLPIIAHHELYGLGFSIDLPSFQLALRDRPDLRRLFNDEPYILCFQLILDDILSQVEKSNSNEALAFIHEENEYQGMAAAAFSSLKSQRSRHKGPMSLTFASKDAFTPLQAADVLAFETNKRMRDPLKRGRRSFQAINAEGRIRVEGFTKESMPTLVHRLDLLAQEIKIFGEFPRAAQGA